MAINAMFESKPRYGFASLNAANTDRDGSGTLVDVLQGVASPGTKIDLLVLKATGQVPACMLLLFYFDGTNNNLFDEIAIPATAAGSTTVAAFRSSKTYSDLVLADSTHKLKACVTVIPTSGVLLVEAFGGDLT